MGKKIEDENQEDNGTLGTVETLGTETPEETTQVVMLEEKAPEIEFPPISDKHEKFARHMLEVQKNIDAVYVVGGLFFTDRKRAEGRCAAKGGYMYTVKR